MKLLGDWNWYLPRWLQWIPELDHEGGTSKPSHAPRLNPAPSPA
jgi:RND superfamily putative drug exporter